LRQINRAQLQVELTAAREKTMQLVDCLQPSQWQVPRLPTMNPPLWELGHVGWFQENWCVRWQADGKPMLPSILPQSDDYYDSSEIPNQLRWDLPMPGMTGTREYLAQVLALTLDNLQRAPDTDDGLYFFRLALFHEKMHAEAFVYTWQSLGYEVGHLFEPPAPVSMRGDIKISGGTHQLGSLPGQGFVFDNEKWAHEVEVASFEIASSPILNAEYASFVYDGGYSRSEYWEPEYFASMKAAQQSTPVHWKIEGGRLEQRWFGVTSEINPLRPMMHVNAFEAQAYCRWSGRRLPTEIEWEYAATQGKGFKWGHSVWEWTSSNFEPFAGFLPDAYKDYSEPWFYNHRVVRGGSFATPDGIAHLKLRNFYLPQRNDLFVGFRTCVAA
jgi:gamma-glutamyl hercynylcysteine S-oxide synthase